MQPVSITVLRPTRGLEFAESTMAIELAKTCALARGQIDIASAIRPMLRTWAMKIPDSFNHLVRMFRLDPTDYAWFVEEDVVVPDNALEAMLATGNDVATILYNLKGGGPNRLSEVRTDWGELHTLATGCMLIKRRVFEGLPDPWFRTDISPGLRHPGSSTANPYLDLIASSFPYGGHDGFFTLSAIRAGFQCGAVADLRCEHLNLDRVGTQHINDGCHYISRVE